MHDLIIADLAPHLPSDHRPMLADIALHKPMIDAASRHFGKRQSQFMDRLLTVNHPTPIRNLRQCLSEIENAMAGLRENYYRLRRAQVEADEARHRARSWFITRFKRQKLILDAEEREAGIAAAQVYVGGCIRRIAGHVTTFRAILASMGATSINEVDFEREEERYHIAKAFEQALCAARSRGGLIDEGNHLYLHQLGINGGAAQAEVTTFLRDEEAHLARGQAPVVHSWLMGLADKYAGCAQRVMDDRGTGPALSESAALRKA